VAQSALWRSEAGRRWLTSANRVQGRAQAGGSCSIKRSLPLFAIRRCAVLHHPAMYSDPSSSAGAALSRSAPLPCGGRAVHRLVISPARASAPAGAGERQDGAQAFAASRQGDIEARNCPAHGRSRLTRFRGVSRPKPEHFYRVTLEPEQFADEYSACKGCGVNRQRTWAPRQQLPRPPGARLVRTGISPLAFGPKAAVSRRRAIEERPHARRQR